MFLGLYLIILAYISYNIVGHVTLSCNYTVKTLVSIPMAIYMYRNAYVNLFFQKLQRMKWCRHCFPSLLKMMTR